MNDPTVEYRPITGMPGYRVGTDGSIWSLWRPHPGRGMSIGQTWRRLRGGLRKGYPAITFRVGGVTVVRSIAVVVLTEFVGPRPAPDMEAAHEDGDPTNNRLSNLAWKTKLENADDKRRHGTMCRGETSGAHKLTAAQVLDLVAGWRAGESREALAARFRTCESNVRSILAGMTWGHVTGIVRAQPAGCS